VERVSVKQSPGPSRCRSVDGRGTESMPKNLKLIANNSIFARI